ncbi:MAG TPA: serine/threonine-protein kinase, partial [Polyangiales bacterium]|nr:serine/threonine-protein kinase [Polyangiales bacterium]
MADDSEAASELVSFGKYLLDHELARGGMSRVFLARLRGPGGFEKKLVVKQILPELAADPSFVELFVKEANTLVQMSHPNLVPVYELGVIDDVYFLAMEFVEGATVAELLREGPLPQALAAQIGAQIAEALRYAHERFQIVHRDVTPRNVIIDEAGHARLLDFGIAAPVGHSGRGELFGSPGYIAPEQLDGDALGPESDLFSLGCVLYEAISGKPAYPVTRIGSGFVATREPPPPLAAGDETLIALVGRLASIDRAARPRSASEVSDALRTWLAGHHPLGVDAELAERAVRARAQRLATPPPPSDLPAASSGRIEVRSLAVSPALTELLQQATERIERPSLSHDAAAGASSPPVPETLPDNIGDDPELHRIARRLFRDFVVLSVALIAALLYAQRYPHRDPPVPDDPPPPLAAKSNAVVPTAPAEPIAPPPPSAAGAPSPTPSAAD